MFLAALLLFTVNEVSAHAESSAPVLHLGDGDFLGGELRNCDAPNVVRWQSTVATAPFDFPVTHLSAVHFPPSEHPPAPEGEYGFELSGGDRLFGDLVAISGDMITIHSPPLGTLKLARRHVGRITRRNAERDWVYMGPNGLAGWKQPAETSNWREEAGHLISDVSGAVLRQELELPEQASIEFEISWKKKPDFVLSLGSNLEQLAKVQDRINEIQRQRNVRGQSEAARITGYRFEVWEKSLVIVRESENDADVALVSPLESEGRIHLRAYLDQKTGRLKVYSLEGKRLAEIEVPPGDELTGIELTNKRGDVRLEQLAISNWDGHLPMEVALDKPSVQKSDGTVVYGNIAAFDADAEQFVIAGENGEQRVDAADFSTALVSLQPAVPVDTLRAALHNGASVTGNLVAVRDGQLHLSREGIDGSLALPVSAVRSLLGPGRLNLTPPDGVRVCRLEVDGVRSHGWLVDGAATGEASCLVWQPRQSVTSSPLSAGLSGRLVYRDPPPPRPKTNRPQNRNRPAPRPGVWGGVLDAFGVRRVEQPKQVEAEVKTSAQALLHLRTGDIIPCQVNGIDQEGVHLASSAVAVTFIPHERVQAIELTPSSPSPEVDEKKRQRLLTLPRMQRNNPPTHLIFAKNGDVLRGRLEEMNLEHLAVEIHLEIRDLPREQVASIIWLHKSDASGDDEPKPAPSESELLIHALRPDGIRLTFAPHEVREGALIGASDILGACRVDLRTVDMLLLGSAIHDAAQELEYHTWKLTPAPDPRYLQEESAGGASPSAPTSGLVGQPAPDFRLDLLTGKPFDLSEEKGHVVVLDFWASWCGPCMQAMPLVDEVVREFEPQGVKLVAVNMQEDQATIEAALERLKLNPLVVLDIDGATAEKYEVTAIPQTVVIDAEGKVAKLFVGGGLQMAEQLRETLKELTTQE